MKDIDVQRAVKGARNTDRRDWASRPTAIGRGSEEEGRQRLPVRAKSNPPFDEGNTAGLADAGHAFLQEHYQYREHHEVDRALDRHDRARALRTLFERRLAELETKYLESDPE